MYIHTYKFSGLLDYMLLISSCSWMLSKFVSDIFRCVRSFGPFSLEPWQGNQNVPNRIALFSVSSWLLVSSLYWHIDTELPSLVKISNQVEQSRTVHFLNKEWEESIPLLLLCSFLALFQFFRVDLIRKLSFDLGLSCPYVLAHKCTSATSNKHIAGAEQQINTQEGNIW